MNPPRRSAIAHRRVPAWLSVLLGVLAPAALSNPQDRRAEVSDVERMVRDGMVEALQARFRGGRTLDELRLLALAQANKAARIDDDRRRQRAFQEAETRYLTWVSAAERERGLERTQRVVNASAARAACAGMILSQWAVADLDEYELTAGKRGETGRLLELLLKARKLYERTEESLEPLAEELRAGDPETEDRYLALGVFDSLRQLQLDVTFNLAWTNLYVGIINPKSDARRSAALRAAERGFQKLVDFGQSGETGTRCLLGLAMTFREQERSEEAGRCFRSAAGAATDVTLAAQIRYEWARGEIRSGRFQEARIALRPLVEKDPDRLEPEYRPARFYVNLAHLWDANSYLQEALQLRETAETSSARQAILVRAARAREIGLRKMNQLAGRGGAWPMLVQLFVADAIDSGASEKSLSAAELLFSARQYSSKKKYRHALLYLNEAAGRAEVPRELAAEILFELGICHYRCREPREAAEVFDRFARQYKGHPNAAQAITYAYQLWASIADESDRQEDYLRLADVLLNLLQSFPEHEKRSDAMWWLPVALQAGGRFREAAEHFGNVPESSPKWEEAQYRRVLCARLLFDAERSSLSGERQSARARQVTDQLKAYARRAYQRSDAAGEPAVVRAWAGAALVSAAEVYASSGVEQHQYALDLLADFERRFPDSDQIGRVLAVRINAYRALEQYRRAAEVVDQFLRTVPMEQAGSTLAIVARGMQEEVDRLERKGDLEAARQLAAQSLPTFEQLEAWVQRDPSRAAYIDAVRYGLARMRYAAGQYAAARELIDELVQEDPRDGNYQRLNALVLTAQLSEDSGPREMARARDAWGAMLRDPGLRSAVPERYWEARYHYLALMLRSGEAAEVEKAIRQDRVWYPDSGGTAWQLRFDELYERATAHLGEEEESGTLRTGTSQPGAAVAPGPRRP